ncbi:glycoside hydrolase family 88 protein [Flavicella sediminum]|uniref:glycoside hydrolase family 88 protein n=1 Tax=Flavicella sediminum TaxID=2585141 RepID=UPI00111FB5F8|nr:glycoside hydrolase family 88 protein [Flavicella sediminum]
MRILKPLALLLSIILLSSCMATSKKEKISQVEKQLLYAEKQLSLLLVDAEKANKIPRTLDEHGQMHFTHNNFDWTEGFYPGSSWYLYEATGDVKWKNAAEKFQSLFEEHKNRTTNHDLGFVFNCSYGNGYRLTKNEAFKEVMITAGNSLLTRFNPNVGCIKSWDVDNGWQATRGWEFPVIIDNMMNLELLFELSKLTGDMKYQEVAIAHADTTLKNHFRSDNSSYHVIDYDAETGAVRNKHTAQGFAHESSWARGQAWGIYGYTVCYRYTKNVKYLNQAVKIADYILNYKGMPTDGIPYWDYNAANIPNEPRDVSAATVTVAALIELDGYTETSYLPEIDKILRSLATEEYTAKLGKNKNFLLKHSVGSIPHNNEIDVPLNYADYYYLEALLKYEDSYSPKN